MFIDVSICGDLNMLLETFSLIKYHNFDFVRLNIDVEIVK